MHSIRLSSLQLILQGATSIFSYPRKLISRHCCHVSTHFVEYQSNILQYQLSKKNINLCYRLTGKLKKRKHLFQLKTEYSFNRCHSIHDMCNIFTGLTHTVQFGELFLYRNACVRTVCMWVPQLFLYKSPSLAIASWQLRCVVCVSYLGTITFARYIVLSLRGIVFRALPVCMRSVVFGCLVSSVAVLVSLPVSLSALSFFRLDCVELRQFAFKTPFLEA